MKKKKIKPCLIGGFNCGLLLLLELASLVQQSLGPLVTLRLLQNLKIEIGCERKRSQQQCDVGKNLLEMGESSLDIVLVVQAKAPGETEMIKMDLHT